MKKSIQPYVLRLISSNMLRSIKRAYYICARIFTRGVPKLEIFIKVDDPYSLLLIQTLPILEKKYQVNIKARVIINSDPVMFPELAMWNQHSVNDALHLANVYRLHFPCSATRVTHQARSVFTASCAVQQKIDEGASWADIAELLLAYWKGVHIDASSSIDEAALEKRFEAHLHQLSSKGHYLPATIYYDGEWYWGVDRLDHLERRLIEEGYAIQSNTKIEFNKTYASLFQPLNDANVKEKHAEPLTLFWSARSPYSYIALLQAVKLTMHYGIPLEVKPVLPMMMRGLYVPPTKAMYIFLDTKREAQKQGIEYGFLADPLGEGVERCYALLAYARENNKYIDYLLSFAKSVNAHGVRADTDSGMRKIVEGAGLSWQEAKLHLTNTDYKEEVSANQTDIYQKGSWGVPVFRYKDIQVWGQDRLFVMEDTIRQYLIEKNVPNI
ncbi:DsbA family protein [Alteromonas sp. 1_MG-2023]|uniref:DsbA family protein n=1 Tax=Alteromonas sp. 1_MG-2023 TaxID=3062669 RepID=UPI0026E29E35|nr:DsbA family protein [Alteromonas sp. 1_MG-2023]MDO6568176.1 DsbA family protein [Alteromonas sp. 1_MG-2023]